MGYSLCASTATFDELEASLQQQYYQILPLGGVVRTAPMDCRMVDAGFYCPSLTHPGVEALIAMSNKLLMHYGCRTALGTLLKTSYSMLLLEVGVSFQPLQSSYRRFSFLAAHSWMKMLWEKVCRFDIVLQTADLSFRFPRREDKFLMLVFWERGHSRDTLLRLKRVRLHLQIIFLSDILSASGLMIDPLVLERRPQGVKRSTMRWPREEPTDSDFDLWREAVEDISPTRLRVHSVGEFVADTHCISPWRWCPVSNTLLHSGADSTTTEVYFNTTRKANRLTQTATIPQREDGDYCFVEEIQPGVHRVTSTARRALPTPTAESFLDILSEWGCTWMWEHLSLEGGSDWLPAAIQDNSLVAVADASYIRQMYPDLCATAFVLECKKGQGRIIGSFSEESIAANAYRGELLGIMAVHLILVSVNRLNSLLAGSVEVVSDLGALSRVVNLPLYRIPSRSKHSDILKNTLVNCRDLSFSVHFSHIKAHQDDRTSFDKLSRKAQLNCICDHLAKQRVGEAGQSKHSVDLLFPLEPIGIFIDGKKLSSEPGPQLRFHAHRQLAKALFL